MNEDLREIVKADQSLRHIKSRKFWKNWEWESENENCKWGFALQRWAWKMMQRNSENDDVSSRVSSCVSSSTSTAFFNSSFVHENWK